MSRPSQRFAGFTLIELIVALALFALVSVFAYRGLNVMLESRASLEADSRKWRDVALFVGRIERDLQAILDRRALSGAGSPQAAVSSTLDTSGNIPGGLALTRSGAALQENALAAPQRIAYRFNQGRVERLAWPSVDAAPRAEPVAMPVLSGVKSLAFRFLDARGEWRTSWGLPGAAEPMPAAVEVILELASGERIVRLVDLPRTS